MSFRKKDKGFKRVKVLEKGVGGEKEREREETLPQAAKASLKTPLFLSRSFQKKMECYATPIRGNQFLFLYRPILRPYWSKCPVCTPNEEGRQRKGI